MLDLRTNANVLTLRDIPVGYWLGALLLILLFVACFAAWLPNMLDGQFEFVPIALLTVMLAGVGFYGSATVTETSIDANLRLVTIWRRGVFRKNFVKIPFERIDGGAILREFTGNHGNTIYSIDLLLKDQTVRLMERAGPEEGPIFQAVEQINRYLCMELSATDYQPLILDEN